jgi:hypothetical protein
LKNNPLQQYHAGCFGMDQKPCHSFFTHCLLFLHAALMMQM